MTKQHKNATTTHEVRAFIHQSDLATAVLARLLKVSESTVRKWRNRASTEDISHLPKQLNTKLSLPEQYVIVHLRLRLKLSLDELLNVCKTFINSNTSRAGLQRCLKRHGVSRLTDMQNLKDQQYDGSYTSIYIEESTSSTVINSVVSPQAMSDVLNQMRQQMMDDITLPLDKLTAADVVQVYVITLPDCLNPNKDIKISFLMAHDLHSHWIYVDLYYNGDEYQAAERYIKYVLSKGPYHLRRLLVKNYNEFLSRFRLLTDKKNNKSKIGNANEF